MIRTSPTAKPFDDRFEPPFSTLQVGLVRGGEALNVVPDYCASDVEARAIAGVAANNIARPSARGVRKGDRFRRSGIVIPGVVALWNAWR